MAVMIPTTIDDLEKAKIAHEDEIFNKLKEINDNNLYVFHSYVTMDMHQNTLEEHEIDFIIFHRELGLIVMEAKASTGTIYFDRQWFYRPGKPMNHDPFKQADRNKWVIHKALSENPKFSSIRYLTQRIKFIHCVCFPTMSSDDCDKIVADGSYNRQLLITKDDLDTSEKLWKKLKKISEINLPTSIKFNQISDDDATKMIDNFLCPHLNAFKLRQIVNHDQTLSFFILKEKQSLILDFLELEDSVAICGGAGTGKTIVAVEKARRLATTRNENVIFLCFNRELKDKLEKENPINNVKFYTFSGFITALSRGNMDALKEVLVKLEEMYLMNQDLQIGNQIYKHIIVDEGQDFGSNDNGELESSKMDLKEEILNILHNLILEREGSFYVFYDKQQKIQSGKIPSFIKNQDSRLSLSQNIRNTQDIGKTAAKTISDKRCYKLNTVTGDTPVYHLIDNSVHKQIQSIINKQKSLSNDIVIITTKDKLTDSCIFDKNHITSNETDGYTRYYYKMEDGNKYLFTTSRKFKGCEADSVILLDVDKKSFLKDENGQDTQENYKYYVGASRAKKRLEILFSITEDDCKELLPLINERYKKIKSNNYLSDFMKSLALSSQ
ncbi:MAG: NERD domain-containing protein [Treponema sp.]|nr:NERD domain-containing protein [Treponema sp.]